MTIPHTRLTARLCALIAIAISGSALADTVAGHFQHRGQRAEFSHGIAIRWLDAAASGGHQIDVLLADAQPDAERGRGKRNPLGNIEAGLPFDSKRLTLHLAAGETSVEIVRVSHDGLIAVAPSAGTIELRDGRLIGAWKIDSGTPGADDWEADLRFDLPLIDLTAGSAGR